MTPEKLNSIVSKAPCRVHGWEDAGNAAHRLVLASVIQTLTSEDEIVLCEPSLTRTTSRPPDVVLLSDIAGLHVIEVKGIQLSDVAEIKAGGQFEVRYASGSISRNPFAQVRNAMFDIRDVAVRLLNEDLIVPCFCWVVLPNISRQEWKARWGEASLLSRELLFREDLSRLGSWLVEQGRKRLEGASRKSWPSAQINALAKAFGDSSVLLPASQERETRKVREATLGEMFDHTAEIHKSLSDEQQRLSAQPWEKGPRIIRGVAGSGKTIVLANNLARRLERAHKRQQGLFDKSLQPRILAVCFNRTLAPFLHKKIGIAYQQRTGKPLAEGAVEVTSFNGLMYQLSRKGLFRYQPVEPNMEVERAARYLSDLLHEKNTHPDFFADHFYDAIYVDEGQDFCEDEFRILAELCQKRDGEPSLFIFYDDAQNLYARQRPHWQSLGLNVLGNRSHVMTECFRNTRQIVEAAFNVLYGSFANDKKTIPSKAYGDLPTLEEKQILAQIDGRWLVRFALRDGNSPVVKQFPTSREEGAYLIERLQWLIEEQEVRPQDILILANYWGPLRELADRILEAKIKGVEKVHIPFDQKDALLGMRGNLTLSTVHSAKGYDAYCVLLIAAEEFEEEVKSRALFYVGCTRAIEYLEVTGVGEQGLFREFRIAASKK